MEDQFDARLTPGQVEAVMAEAIADHRRPFSIGLRPIAPSAVLQRDDQLDQYLALKRRLLEDDRARVWAEEPGSRDAQEAARALVGVSAGTAEPPLLDAALAAQEDLILLRRDDRGWRLTAASLSFPSSWSLAEKFGRPMIAIHHHVPGYGPGARNAMLIDRMFDAFQPGAPVERFGWAIYADAELPKPLATEALGGGYQNASDAVLATPHLRVERQTLSKLPISAPGAPAILFTVRIFVRAMDARPGADDPLARLLAARLKELTEPQITYKNIAGIKDALIAKLLGAKHDAEP